VFVKVLTVNTDCQPLIHYSDPCAGPTHINRPPVEDRSRGRNISFTCHVQTYVAKKHIDWSNSKFANNELNWGKKTKGRRKEIGTLASDMILVTIILHFGYDIALHSMKKIFVNDP
jgi:hypothetical protein